MSQLHGMATATYSGEHIRRQLLQQLEDQEEMLQGLLHPSFVRSMPGLVFIGCLEDDTQCMWGRPS